MYKILETKNLAKSIYLFRIEAPLIASKARAGQFVVLRVSPKGERIPLTLAEWDPQRGTITIVFMIAGATTCQLSKLKEGDNITDMLGPLGNPTEITNYGTVACVAGGFAIAVIRPVVKALKEAGNRVISIVGVRTRDLLFWEEELRKESDELILTTDDGSYGRKGMVTDPLKELLEGPESINRVIAIGPTVMMKFISLTTKPSGIKTITSLNPIMVDGTGMCGCCRVSVGGETKFACVDGPEFDGHLVDWDELMSRQSTYLDQENHAYKCLTGTGEEHRS